MHICACLNIYLVYVCWQLTFLLLARHLLLVLSTGGMKDFPFTLVTVSTNNFLLARSHFAESDDSQL